MQYMRHSIFLIFSLLFSSSIFADTPSDSLVEALIKIESNGDDYAIGDKHLEQKAFGCLQIRQPCVDDVNRYWKTSFQAEDCLGNRQLSLLICRRYLELYATEERIGKKPTDQDMARIWNGGPVGCFDSGMLDIHGRMPKTEKIKAKVADLQRKAKAYWQKVKKELGS